VQNVCNRGTHQPTGAILRKCTRQLKAEPLPKGLSVALSHRFSITISLSLSLFPSLSLFLSLSLSLFLSSSLSLSLSLSLSEDIDSKVTIFNNYLLNCYDKHALLRCVSPKHFLAPWFTVDITGKMIKRNRARRTWTDEEWTLIIHTIKSLEIGFKSLFVRR